MKPKIFGALLFLAAVSLVAACQGAAPSGGDKVIKSAKSGDVTVALSSSTGELKSGENELTVTFTDASGKPIDLGDASLNFHMAAMGSMAEMNNRATLTATDTAGKYRVQVNIGMASEWEPQVKYQGVRGSGQVSMSVQAK